MAERGMLDPVQTRFEEIGNEQHGGFRVGMGDGATVKRARLGTAVRAPHLVRFVQKPVSSDPVEDRDALLEPDKTVTFAILPADDKTVPEVQCEDSAGNPYRRKMQRLGIDGEYDRYKAGMERPLADGTPITSMLIPMQSDTAEALIAEAIQTYEQIAMTPDEVLDRILGPDVGDKVKGAALRFVSKTATDSERTVLANELQATKKKLDRSEQLRAEEADSNQRVLSALEQRLNQLENRESGRAAGISAPGADEAPATPQFVAPGGSKKKATRKKATRSVGPAPPGSMLDQFELPGTLAVPEPDA